MKLLHINFLALTVITCLILVTAALWQCVRDSQLTMFSGSARQSDPKSLDEKYARALARSVRYEGLYGLDLYKKYGKDNLLNAVRRLLPLQNPDAEFVEACLFEAGENRSGLCNGALGIIDEIYAVWRMEADTQAVQKMYMQAYEHGSPQAATALTRFERDNDKIIELYKVAIARGDDDAKIEYALFVRESSPQEAMKLLEEALHAENQDTVDFAMQSLLREWNELNIPPSATLRGDSNTAFDFARKFNSKLTHDDFAHFFVVWGCSPEPYGALRWEVLGNIRKGCGFHSGCIDITL